MKRVVFVVAICFGTLLLLTHCASEDDPFPLHPASSDNTAEPVPGAGTPVPNSSASGWSW